MGSAISLNEAKKTLRNWAALDGHGPLASSQSVGWPGGDRTANLAARRSVSRRLRTYFGSPGFWRLAAGRGEPFFCLPQALLLSIVMDNYRIFLAFGTRLATEDGIFDSFAL